ncbi:MAG: DUF3169 family protein [Lachnoclostridium sp.]|nr:DUF3169 family protein [Lachnoclostridium sp.]
MKAKKVNSYIKLILFMALGGVFGGLMAFGLNIIDVSLRNIMDNSYRLAHDNGPVILGLILTVVLITAVICYRKGENIIKMCAESPDDENQDILDMHYDYWCSVGLTVSNVGLIISMVIFGCVSTDPTSSFIVNLVLFLVNAIVASSYQIAAVKQSKRKDPSKFDDAMDLKFQKKWIDTCDEAEKEIIYQSSYKTFNLVKSIFPAGIVIALLFHLYWGNGMLAMVLLAVIYLIMQITYTVNVLKLQKTRING